MTTKIIFASILIFSIVIPFGVYLFSEKKKGSFIAALGFNILFFFGTLIIADIFLFGGKISAAEADAVTNTAESGWKYMAAALSTGLSCIGAGIAVASAASSALGALSEDSSIMGKALIFVALAESIALYGLLISFTILG
ncbi:ATP synthase subunit C [Anaeromicropila populeti]|uniref:V/A-type H+-transporting ATPase subunit K n=1 Tax=Anaeromicropila populeti TaxID=37658 RepID=A0A1I6LAZ0_9FIRM|nr:ATP synthase subunit C [Anaeromicropila populeti]SFS00652.1 V/A-type H+-transporting ATPase subunit K [Anaeromicropila populeti]